MRLAVLGFVVLPLCAGVGQQGVERPIGSMIAETAPGLVPYDSRAFRVLSSGAIVVAGRSVQWIDASLLTAITVLDTAREQPPSMPIGIVLPEANMATGARRYGIAPFAGDTTIVVASDGVSMTLIDGNGRVGRELALPFGDFRQAILSAGSASALDSRGRLVVQRSPLGARGGDSVPVIRVELKRRLVDTVATVGAFHPWGVASDRALRIDRGPYHGGFAATDRLGRLWVRRDLPEADRRANGDAYDVIDAAGAVVDRVRVRSGGTIIGFTDDAVYLRTSTGIEARALR